MSKSKQYLVWEKYNSCIIKKELKPQYTKWWTKKRLFVFQCFCWNEFICRITNLLSWNTKSCWCLHKNFISNLNKTHGMSWTRFYNIRKNIIRRCRDKNNKYYWAKWITVCDERFSFQSFFKDMYVSYKHDLEIDRIDFTKWYSKENCRWVTELQQAQNTSSNILYKWKCLSQYCRDLWLNYDKMRSKIKSMK